MTKVIFKTLVIFCSFLNCMQSFVTKRKFECQTKYLRADSLIFVEKVSFLLPLNLLWHFKEMHTNANIVEYLFGFQGK